MKVKVIAVTMYGFFGTVLLVIGGMALLLSTGLLPGFAEEIIIDFGHGDPNTLHIVQEFASALAFIGLIALLSIRYYDRSMPFHWAMTAFLGLFAWVHWLDPLGALHVEIGQAINTIPFVLFMIVGLLPRSMEGREA